MFEILRETQYFFFHSIYLGIDRFFELIKDAEVEYENDYRLEYERLREAKKNAEKVRSIFTIIKHRWELYYT